MDRLGTSALMSGAPDASANASFQQKHLQESARRPALIEGSVSHGTAIATSADDRFIRLWVDRSVSVHPVAFTTETRTETDDDANTDSASMQDRCRLTTRRKSDWRPAPNAADGNQRPDERTGTGTMRARSMVQSGVEGAWDWPQRGIQVARCPLSEWPRPLVVASETQLPPSVVVSKRCFRCWSWHRKTQLPPSVARIVNGASAVGRGIGKRSFRRRQWHRKRRFRCWSRHR